MESLNKIMRNKWYILFVAAIVMPVCGYIIGRGDVLLGVILTLLQYPFLARAIITHEVKHDSL